MGGWQGRPQARAAHSSFQPNQLPHLLKDVLPSHLCARPRGDGVGPYLHGELELLWRCGEQYTDDAKVYNACPFTIWPAMFTDLHAGSAVPDHSTGWEAPAWSKVTFNVPDNWTAGRIWVS